MSQASKLPPLPLSATIITLNAASQLEACLASLDFCDDIVVVDSGSQDGTQALAEKFGARVIDHAWCGFGPQKQYAVDSARHDWVLCLDADERVSPTLQASIRQIFAGKAEASLDDGVAAFRFPRCNRFLGRFLRHGEGYPDLSLRLFDRRQARWSDDAVHEKVITQGQPALLAGDLLHESAESLSAYLAKQNRYTSLAAAAACARGKRTGFAQLLLSPGLRFIKFYILRRGFLDGLPGLIHILIGCGNSFIKYAKLIELQYSQQESDKK